ncbi:MAG: hypothetical protein ACTMIR_01750 [Cellulomonadaceae bacterium]
MTIRGGGGRAATGLVRWALAREMIDSVDALSATFFDLFSADGLLASHLAYLAAFMTPLDAVPGRAVAPGRVASGG